VLSKWCNQKSFVLAFNVAGRQSEHRHIVGYFSHILYLRVNLTGEETYLDLLRRVSDEFFRSLMHQDFGLMAAQYPEPLSGTFFQWITWHQEESEEPPASGPGGDLRIERVPMREFSEGITAVPPGVAAVELTVFDTKDGVECHGVYRADLFTSDTIAQFIRELRSTAEEFVRDPQAEPLARSPAGKTSLVVSEA
jgi:non-ribosomal peptide synthetase component F